MIELPNISFETTAQCNLNCKYCYNHHKCNTNEITKPSTYNQTSKTLKKILKIAKVKHISFTGGEPMLAERFTELVLYARLKGVLVTIISNGTYPIFADYKQLKDLGVSLFELPIHSSYPQTHDYLTQHKGSWEKSTTTIKNLLQIEAQVVAVIVLTKQNCHDVSKTIDYIKSLGISRIMVNRINLGGEATKFIKELVMTRDELGNAFKTISEKAIELKISISSNVCTPICILNPKEYLGVRFSSCSFDFSERPLTLDYNGNVRFCNHSPKIIGNIFVDDLTSILNSNEVQQWKNIIPTFCTNCIAFEKCKAGCRAASEQMQYSLNHPDPIINYIEPDSVLLKDLRRIP